MRILLLTSFFVLISIFSYAQTVLDKTIPVVQGEVPLRSVLIQFEKQNPVKFFYTEEWLDPFVVDETLNGFSLRQLLDRQFKDSGMSYKLMFGYAIILTHDPSGLIEREKLLTTAIAEQKDIESINIGDRKSFKPGKKILLSGLIKEETIGSVMPGVTIVVNRNASATTDDRGFYRLELPMGEHVVTFQSATYRDKVIDLKIYESGTLNIIMEQPPTVLEEVIVSDQAIVNRRVSQTTLRVSDLKRAPTFLGEIDIIKQIQNQPGVTTAGEVASGFNVRGGGVDQNLVLYDGVPVFNTAHAFGFFTAFNSDAINQVSFYRGGIPAEFGGRVSSVLDIHAKEGPVDKWKGGGGIGIISSYITIGGPIKPDTTLLIASVRASYSDWMLKTIKSNYKNIENSSVSFYDASLKLSHKFSSKTKLTFSGYTSFDRFSLVNDTIYNSQNYVASMQLNHSVSEKLFASLSFGFGKYTYKMIEEDSATAFDLNYSITYPAVKLDFNYDGEHDLSFGLHNTWYDFNPGLLNPTSPGSGTRRIEIEHERSLETALYLSDAFYWRENLFVEAGLRASMFNRMGPGTVYQYESGKPHETRNITDSTRYDDGDIVKTYFGLEPRLSVRYILDPVSSIKVGYNRMYQYMHLITNTAAVTPVDIWQSSNAYFKPQIADQISVGYYRNLKDNAFEAFTEVFYKHIQNILDFKDGANLILNKNLETALLAGTGKAYGVELSVSKIKGRLLGSVNYTYSRSWRKVNGALSQEKINDGSLYPSNYDQPHVATLNWRYGFSRRHFFSGTFTYHTGRPMSLPLSGYKVDNIPIANFSDRNLYRIPDYHRLDIAFIIEGNHKRKKLWDGNWVFSFYNVYGRKNAYSVFYQDDGDGYMRPYKLSVIGSIVPSVSYSFKF